MSSSFLLVQFYGATSRSIPPSFLTYLVINKNTFVCWKKTKSYFLALLKLLIIKRVLTPWTRQGFFCFFWGSQTVVTLEDFGSRGWKLFGSRLNCFHDSGEKQISWLQENVSARVNKCKHSVTTLSELNVFSHVKKTKENKISFKE